MKNGTFWKKKTIYQENKYYSHTDKAHLTSTPIRIGQFVCVGIPAGRDRAAEKRLVPHVLFFFGAAV